MRLMLKIFIGVGVAVLVATVAGVGAVFKYKYGMFSTELIENVLTYWPIYTQSCVRLWENVKNDQKRESNDIERKLLIYNDIKKCE